MPLLPSGVPAIRVPDRFTGTPVIFPVRVRSSAADGGIGPTLP